MTTQTTSEGPVGPSALFAVGDWVKLNPDSEYEYEVAEIRRFPHGFMVGIYDEPPSKHVDFWNASSLTLSRKANGGSRSLDRMVRRLQLSEEVCRELRYLLTARVVDQDWSRICTMLHKWMKYAPKCVRYSRPPNA